MNTAQTSASNESADAGLPLFASAFTDNLPADPITANRIRQVEGACYSWVQPTQVAAPSTVAYSAEVAHLLDLPAGFCDSQLFAEVMAGNAQLDGMAPYAMCYGGHQFGNWAGQLGDGRAINLGEIVNRRGDRHVLQLKGAGPTPYSRSADGRAVLRSSVREFLCSEAMHHLGVPTTRALSLVTTGEQVVRDMFYDGRAMPEPGAIVCRVSPSFTRIGSFEIFASRGDTASLQQLLDFTIRSNFEHLGEPDKSVYIAWYEEVCRRTATLVIDWMRVGFVHGVLNTDNMSVLGLTIDYGPYGWLDDYDPDWTPNTTDAQGKRYRFGAQPQIAHWNLAQLGNAIYPLVEDVDALQGALAAYAHAFGDGFNAMMAAKLGLNEIQPATDESLIKDLQSLLQGAETDMTIFYRTLADFNPSHTAAANGDDASLTEFLTPAFYEPLTDEHRVRVAGWLRGYGARLLEDNRDDAERRDAMNRVNPKYVLRNYLAQLAIDKSEQGDHSLIHELLELMRRPYDDQPDKEEYAARRPDWARQRAGCSMLSCSS